MIRHPECEQLGCLLLPACDEGECDRPDKPDDLVTPALPASAEREEEIGA